jgi:ATP phosphoribosyltransferase regulatory subunit HisZ
MCCIQELRTLFTFVQAMGALGPVTLDLSLARGLDYYTGLIYEAVLKVRVRLHTAYPHIEAHTYTQAKQSTLQPHGWLGLHA